MQARGPQMLHGCRPQWAVGRAMMGERRVLILTPRYVAAETSGKVKLCHVMEPETVRGRVAKSSGSARSAVAGRQAVASSKKRVDAACQEPEASMARAAP
eukprot:16427145-Heterocapsa_arctica.AAC.1